jgi:hypothetical protein
VIRSYSPYRFLFLLTALFIFVAAASIGARQAPAIAGSWKLNEASSNNPNGMPDAPAARRGGGGGGGGKGTSVDVTGGSRPNQDVSQLSPEETKRIKMMLGLLNKAAQVLDVVIEGNEVTIKQDGGGFPKQTFDGKKSVLKNPQIGEVDIKVKIDAKGMTREVVTQDDLKVVETYALSADGKQLVVTLKASQPVMKIEDAKIKRVYDRQ